MHTVVHTDYPCIQRTYKLTKIWRVKNIFPLKKSTFLYPSSHQEVAPISLPFNLGCLWVAVTIRMQRKWCSEAFESGFKRTGGFYFFLLEIVLPCSKEVWTRSLSLRYYAQRGTAGFKAILDAAASAELPAKGVVQIAGLPSWAQAMYTTLRNYKSS